MNYQVSKITGGLALGMGIGLIILGIISPFSISLIIIGVFSSLSGIYFIILANKKRVEQNQGSVTHE